MSPSSPDDDDTDQTDLAEALEVPQELDGQRLDVVAAQLFSEYSRSRLQAWIADGSLTVNGEKAAKGRQPVHLGDFLRLDAVLPEDPGIIKPENIPVDVVYQDEHLIIVNKPAGLTVHPGAGQRNATLQNALLHHFPQTAAVPRAGIVHRLDKDTSGVLVVALTLQTHTRLVAMLADRDIHRQYDAIVQGDVIAGGTVDAPIGRHKRDRLKMAVVNDGRYAVTHYRVEERYPQQTWLRVQLETGRTHQIRVHMAHIRHPIVGDRLYGGSGTQRSSGLSEASKAVLTGFSRQALHARMLEFDHPITGEPVSVTVQPPEDMQALIAALRAQ